MPLTKFLEPNKIDWTLDGLEDQDLLSQDSDSPFQMMDINIRDNKRFIKAIVTGEGQAEFNRTKARREPHSCWSQRMGDGQRGMGHSGRVLALMAHTCSCPLLMLAPLLSLLPPVTMATGPSPHKISTCMAG
jgi:hypothetical protein